MKGDQKWGRDEMAISCRDVGLGRVNVGWHARADMSVCVCACTHVFAGIVLLYVKKHYGYGLAQV